MTKWVVAAAVVAGMLWAETALAKATPEQVCAVAKQKAAGLAATRKLNCYGKRGASYDLATCLLEAKVKLTKAFRSAEFTRRGVPRGCAISGDTAATETLVDHFVAAAVAAIPPGEPSGTLATSTVKATPGQVCAAAKQKAAGLAVTRKLKCHGVYAKRSASLDLSTCLVKVDVSLTKAFWRAEFTKRGVPRGCAISGDTAATETLVDNFVAAVVEAIPPGEPSIQETPAASKTPTIPKTPTPTRTPTTTKTPPLTGTPTTTKTPTATATTTSTATATSTATPTHSFVDNGDGTITDLDANLMWEKKSDDGSIHDVDNTYTWSTGTNNPNGTAFTVFLAQLNTPPCFAGHCDWRLPNEDGQSAPFTGPKELESILAAPYPCNGQTNPCVSPVFNTNCVPGCTVEVCSCTESYFYWSTTINVNFPTIASMVGFYNGYVANGNKTYDYYVRAVRSDL